MLSKTELRQQLSAQRNALSATEQNVAAIALAQQITSQPIFQKAHNIALYLPYKGEISTKSLLRENKNYYLPILDHQQERHLLFMPYKEGDVLQLNRYKIAEPVLDKNNVLAPQQLDLMLLPLVAFDKQGHRLGMGAGYYDFTLAFLKQLPRPNKPYLIGLAYDWQRVEQLPAEDWDVTLDAVVTDQNFYVF